MRWILPLLSLALVPAAFGEIAVYTGLQVVQNASNPDGSSIVRIADVIDLATGKIVTVGLSGGHPDFSYAVGPEVQYVVAKTTDGHGHGLTAFAQAATDTDSAGSKFAIAANLRGRDSTVTLSAAASSQWPRTLLGSGSLVAAAGTDPATTPASASYSTIALTLNEGWSKAANAAGGTLTQEAEVVAQQFRNRAATLLKVTPTNNSVVAGATTSGGLTKAGAGTLVFGSTSNSFVGAVTITNGTLQLNRGGSPAGGVTTSNGGTSSGGTLTLNGGTLTLGGTLGVGTILGGGTIVSGGTITGGGTLTLGGTTGGTIVSGGTTTSGGTLQLGGTQSSGAVTTIGSGSLLLSGANTFTGGGTIVGGINQVSNAALTVGNWSGVGATITYTNFAPSHWPGSGASNTIVTGSGAGLSYVNPVFSLPLPIGFNDPNAMLTLLGGGSLNPYPIHLVGETTTTLPTHPVLGNVVITRPLGNLSTLVGATSLQGTTAAAVPADQ